MCAEVCVCEVHVCVVYAVSFFSEVILLSSELNDEAKFKFLVLKLLSCKSLTVATEANFSNQ